MMWQDMVFLIGSMTSVTFLFPTLRNTASQVPRATSIPSMLIGAAYSFTFLTLGMTFSATGSFAACTMWSLIAAFRAPDSGSLFEDLPVSTDNVVVRALAAPYRRIVNGHAVGRSGDDSAGQSPVTDAGDGMADGIDVAANSD